MPRNIRISFTCQVPALHAEYSARLSTAATKARLSALELLIHAEMLSSVPNSGAWRTVFKTAVEVEGALRVSMDAAAADAAKLVAEVALARACETAAEEYSTKTKFSEAAILAAAAASRLPDARVQDRADALKAVAEDRSIFVAPGSADRASLLSMLPSPTGLPPLF